MDNFWPELTKKVIWLPAPANSLAEGGNSLGKALFFLGDTR